MCNQNNDSRGDDQSKPSRARTRNIMSSARKSAGSSKPFTKEEKETSTPIPFPKPPNESGSSAKEE